MDKKEKILVIDDDESLSTLIKEVFEDEGFTVVTAADGDQGFKVFEKERPDLIIIDGLLPKTNGFQLTAQIRTTDHGKQLPMIMISGIYKAFKMQSEIHSLGIDSFFEKPFDIDELLSKAQQLLLISPDDHYSDNEFFENEGDIANIGIPRLLYLLYRSKENGVLNLKRHRLKKRVYFKNGEPTFIESNLVQECFGKLLVKRGRLTQEQCDESLRVMKTTKKRQGEALISMGILEPAELDDLLKDQAREKLLEVFTWNSGKYEYIHTEDNKEGLTSIDVNIAQIILRGVRGGYALEQIKNEIAPSLDREIVLQKNQYLKFDDFKLATWDSRIVDEFKKKTTARKLLDLKFSREIDVFQLLYVFLKTDQIEFSETEDEKKEKASYNKLVHFLEDLKQQDPFSTLGVHRGADADEIKRSYKRRLNLYHPRDSNRNPTDSLRIDKLLHEITKCFQTAYKLLNNTDERRKLERKLYLEKGIEPGNVEKVFDWEEEVRTIQSLIEKGALEQANQLSQAMAKLFPKEWQFISYLGWSHFKLASQAGKKTEEDLKDYIVMIARAIQIDPTVALNYTFLGRIYKYLDDIEKAKSFYKKALVYDPNAVEAERELRLITMRETKKGRSFIKWK